MLCLCLYTIMPRHTIQCSVAGQPPTIPKIGVDRYLKRCEAYTTPGGKEHRINPSGSAVVPQMAIASPASWTLTYRSTTALHLALSPFWQ